jgi:CheY-like chemotaxis protein
MHLTTAVLVDDRPEQLRLLTRVFQRSGWDVHPAAGSVAGEALAASILAGPAAAHTVILTDMHMPGDPYVDDLPAAAGAYLALRLRARMSWRELPRAPIVGLTSLAITDLQLGALFCGCDALLEKDPPLQLAARITATLEHSYRAEHTAGFDALLRLAQRVPAPPRLTDAAVKAALLAYRRSGVIGLGKSALAQALVPQAASVLQRGEAAYAQILHVLDALDRMGAGAAAVILRLELEHEAAPDERALALALSHAQYYRHRQRAVRQLRDLLVH